MPSPGRVLALLVMLSTTWGVAAAPAQTIVVRHASPGKAVEVVFNGATAATATVNQAGDATMSLPLRTLAGRPETDATMYVDVCPERLLVGVVERGIDLPATGSDCTRRPIPGLFWIREVTTMVVDMAGPAPRMRFRQGPAPTAWLSDELPRVAGPRRPAPAGLTLFGGAGLAKPFDVARAACGDVAQCSDAGFRGAYAAGVTYWVIPYLAIEAGYMRPQKTELSGSGDRFRFDSALDADVFAILGKGGVPIGPVRLYGQYGLTYHQATFATTQTTDETTVTVTVDDQETTQTLKGGTQTIAIRTAGWGWTFGGGGEIWATPRVAVYGEAGIASLKGTAREGEGRLDEHVGFVRVGVKIRVTR